MVLRERILLNVAQVKETISTTKEKIGCNQKVEIVAVTKNQPPEAIETVLAAGINHIGENRIQEAETKFAKIVFGSVYTKRMIGHLQSNKAKKAIRLFDSIDSVDSLKLAQKLDKLLDNNIGHLPVLLQINTSGDEEKFGFWPDEDQGLLACIALNNIEVVGLMTIGPLTDEVKPIRIAFKELRRLMETLNKQKDKEMNPLTVLSMGMSNDYPFAIAEGSTMIRLGRTLFS